MVSPSPTKREKTGIAESIYTVSPGADVTQIRITYNAEVTIQKNGALTTFRPSHIPSWDSAANVFDAYKSLTFRERLLYRNIRVPC